MCKVETPDRNLTDPFLLSIDKAQNIPGRGTVVTGTIEQGKVKVGDNVEIIGGKLLQPMNSTVTGVEAFKKQLDNGQAGDNVGILLRGVK